MFFGLEHCNKYASYQVAPFASHNRWVDMSYTNRADMAATVTIKLDKNLWSGRDNIRALNTVWQTACAASLCVELE
jgi:hypothetical protein